MADKYNTKDIRHIDEKSQEYIAKGNRMTGEIIIFEQDGNIVGITKEGKYFESYKTTENVAILRGAGLYIKRLEQENKELKEENKTAQKEYWKLEQGNDFLAEKIRLYRSALEEIRKECKCYGRQRGSNREFDREYGGELHINIIEQINEVLG